MSAVRRISFPFIFDRHDLANRHVPRSEMVRICRTQVAAAVNVLS